MPADQWLKLHTSLLSSAKFSNISNPKHRWIFVCLMMLCKKGIIKQGESLSPGGRASLRASGCTSEQGSKLAVTALVEAGLVEKNGWVINFEDSQIRPSALRKRLQRERDSHKLVTSNVTTEERGKKKERKKRVSFDRPAQEVLEHLNSVAGTRGTKASLIEARLRAGATVKECKQLIDFKAEEFRRTDNEQYIRQSTLFGPENFKKYMIDLEEGQPVIKDHPFLVPNLEALNG